MSEFCSRCIDPISRTPVQLKEAEYKKPVDKTKPPKNGIHYAKEDVVYEKIYCCPICRRTPDLMRKEAISKLKSELEALEASYSKRKQEILLAISSIEAIQNNLNIRTPALEG